MKVKYSARVRLIVREVGSRISLMFWLLCLYVQSSFCSVRVYVLLWR